jgi:hypothetical protein
MKIVYTSRLHTKASAAWSSTVRPAHILIRPPLREYWLARFTIQFKSSTHMIHLGRTRPGGARVMKPIRFRRTVRIPFGARCRTQHDHASDHRCAALRTNHEYQYNLSKIFGYYTLRFPFRKPAVSIGGRHVPVERVWMCDSSGFDLRVCSQKTPSQKLITIETPPKI